MKNGNELSRSEEAILARLRRGPIVIEHPSEPVDRLLARGYAVVDWRVTKGNRSRRQIAIGLKAPALPRGSFRGDGR